MTPKVVSRDGIGSAGVRFLIDNHEGDMRKLGLIVGAGALAIVLLFGLWILSR